MSAAEQGIVVKEVESESEKLSPLLAMSTVLISGGVSMGMVAIDSLLKLDKGLISPDYAALMLVGSLVILRSGIALAEKYFGVNLFEEEK